MIVVLILTFVTLINLKYKYHIINYIVYYIIKYVMYKISLNNSIKRMYMCELLSVI